MDEVKHGEKKEATLRWHAYRMHFEGAVPTPEIKGPKSRPGTTITFSERIHQNGILKFTRISHWITRAYIPV
jgi:hypothetical protein